MNKEHITPDNEKYMLIPRECLVPSQPDDEISLVDILRIFRQHKRVFYATFIVVLLLSIMFALMRTDNYKYQSTIELGRTDDVRIQNGEVSVVVNGKVIESPATARSKIENSFIPVVRKYIAKKWGADKVFDVKVSVPKNTTVLTLESKGKKEFAEMHTDAHNKILALLRESEKPVFDNVYNALARKLDEAKIELQQLQDDTRFKTKVQAFQNRISAKQNTLKQFRDKIGLIDQKMTSLNKLRNIKLKDLQKANNQLAEFRKIQLNLFSDKTGDSSQKLLTQSMITGEIQRLTRRVSDLEQYLQVTADEQKKSLLNQKTELIRSIEQQKRELQKLRSEFEDFKLSRKDQIRKKEIEIKALQDKLNNLVETRFTSPVQQSIKPTGPGRGLIIALGAVIGIMLGFLFVFMAHLRQVMQESETGQGKLTG